MSAPVVAVETVLAGMWQDLLDVSRTSADDNFFDLGGNSLTATRLAYP